MEENNEKGLETAPPQNINETEFQLNEQSPTIGKLAKALAKCQTELVPASKSSHNPYHKSKYADISMVLKACQSTLGQNGIALTQGSHSSKTGGFYVWTQLTHADSGEYIRTAIAVSLGKADNHGIGSAITYGRRYGISAMVGIATEDDDGNASIKEDKNISVETAPHKTNGVKQGAR